MRRHQHLGGGPAAEQQHPIRSYGRAGGHGSRPHPGGTAPSTRPPRRPTRPTDRGGPTRYKRTRPARIGPDQIDERDRGQGPHRMQPGDQRPREVPIGGCPGGSRRTRGRAAAVNATNSSRTTAATAPARPERSRSEVHSQDKHHRRHRHPDRRNGGTAATGQNGGAIRMPSQHPEATRRACTQARLHAATCAFARNNSAMLCKIHEAPDQGGYLPRLASDT